MLPLQRMLQPYSAVYVRSLEPGTGPPGPPYTAIMGDHWSQCWDYGTDKEFLMGS